MGRLILITNDDGIDAGGIRQLAEAAKAFTCASVRVTWTA